MKRLIKTLNTKKLIRISKLGKAPATAADVKSVLRNLIRENPIEFESAVKEIIASTPGFNEEDLEEAIENYNASQDEETFTSLFNLISDNINEAINRRRKSAEEIVRNQGYKVESLDNNNYKVIDTDDGDVCITNLINETCTCPDYQRINKLGIWCKHLYALFGEQNNLLDMD